MITKRKKRVSLADEAYDKLSDMIVFSKIPSGCIKTEKELSELLNIGRMPVREAVIRLSYENAVKILPYKGIYFPEINLNDFFLQMETRRVLEGLMSGKAAKYANSYERENLINIAEEFKKAVLEKNAVYAMELDDECDRRLVEYCRNPFIGHALRPLLLLGRRLYYENFYANPKSTLDIAFAHCALMNAIAKGNEEAVIHASNKNIDTIIFMVRNGIGAEIYTLSIPESKQE